MPRSAVTLDLGQGRELEDTASGALAIGCVRAHVLDVREEFAKEFILPALQAGAIYEDRYPLATALGRPLIARRLVEIAHLEGAYAIAHGCTGKGNDQVRLDVSSRALDPKIKVIALARVWGMTRPDEIEYARAARYPCAGDDRKSGTAPTRTWAGRSSAASSRIRGSSRPRRFTRSPRVPPIARTNRPTSRSSSMPACRSRSMALRLLVDLIGSLETIAGAHGIGRIDMVENRLVGIVSVRSTRRPRPWRCTPRTKRSRSWSSRAI